MTISHESNLNKTKKRAFTRIVSGGIHHTDMFLGVCQLLKNSKGQNWSVLTQRLET